MVTIPVIVIKYVSGRYKKVGCVRNVRETVKPSLPSEQRVKSGERRSRPILQLGMTSRNFPDLYSPVALIEKANLPHCTVAAKGNLTRSRIPPGVMGCVQRETRRGFWPRPSHVRLSFSLLLIYSLFFIFSYSLTSAIRFLAYLPSPSSYRLSTSPSSSLFVQHR